MAERVAREQPILIALIGAAGVVIAAVIGVVATRGGSPDHPESTPSMTAPPTDQTERLLSFLPKDTVSNCSPTETPFGALVRVKCKATPGTGHVDADVYFSLYENLSSSRNAFEQSVPEVVSVSDRVCPDGPDRSDYDLPGRVKGGLLACYVDPDNKAPYVVWTRDNPGIMGEAVAPVGTELKRLWDVWLTVPINVSPSPSAVASQE